MKNKDVDENILAEGKYCRKGFANCFCGSGWPRERQCKWCAEKTDDRTDWCLNGGFCTPGVYNDVNSGWRTPGVGFLYDPAEPVAAAEGDRE